MSEGGEAEYVPQTEIQVNTIDKWVQANQAVLVSKLEEERLDLLNRGQLTDWRRKSLQPTARTLSEMELCDTWKRDIDPPDGFEVITGAVKTEDMKPKDAIPHTFARNEKGTIICFAPGQFVQPFSNLPPGERIALLQKQAPELIKSYDNGLAVLSGPSSAVAEKLGLSFRLNIW